MKKCAFWEVSMVVVVCLLQTIVGCATTKTEATITQNISSPKIMIGTPDIQIGKNTQVVIKGTGFEPDTEISILFTAIDGVIADIDFALEPKPVANKDGEWATTWNFTRYIKKKLIEPGTYTLTATDKSYNFLAQTTITFQSGK